MSLGGNLMTRCFALSEDLKIGFSEQRFGSQEADRWSFQKLRAKSQGVFKE